MSQPSGSHHAQEGVKYHHLRYVGLDEDDALLRIDACGQPVEHHLMDVGPDLLCGLALHVCEGVNVHGGVDAVVLPLEGDPVLQGAQVVADVQPPGWAHTRKYAFSSCFHSSSVVESTTQGRRGKEKGWSSYSSDRLCPTRRPLQYVTVRFDNLLRQLTVPYGILAYVEISVCGAA